MDISENKKHVIIHEIGHHLMQKHMHYKPILIWINENPNENEKNGFAEANMPIDYSDYVQSQKNQIIICYSGAIFEEIVFGKNRGGLVTDMQNAEYIANNILDNINYEPNILTSPKSEKYIEARDKAISDILQECKEQARIILSDYSIDDVRVRYLFEYLSYYNKYTFTNEIKPNAISLETKDISNSNFIVDIFKLFLYLLFTLILFILFNKYALISIHLTIKSNFFNFIRYMFIIIILFSIVSAYYTFYQILREIKQNIIILIKKIRGGSR